MNFENCLVALALVLAPGAGTTAPAAGSDVLITEVFYDTPSREHRTAWVELFNASAGTVDLSNYYLEHCESQALPIPAGTTIASGQTLIIAGNVTQFFKRFGFRPDLTASAFDLSASGDFLRLHNNQGALLDEVGWGGALQGWRLNIPAGGSLVRTALSVGPQAWHTDRSPVPGQAERLQPIAGPGGWILLSLAGIALMIVLRRES